MMLPAVQHRVWGALRAAVVLGMAGLVAGCFQPLYGERTINGGPSTAQALSGVEIKPIDAPNGTTEARIAVEVQNALAFGMTGGASPAPPTHQLRVRMTSTRLSVIVDVHTARSDVENFGINALYELVDLRTSKVVVKDQTFSRISYDIPGQQQRFARARALRDAENRAAQLIADNIKSRLASYFVAGT
jgi:LPS-assembly lipoprotein